MARKTNAQLQAELDELQAEHSQLIKNLVRVGIKAARENEWCLEFVKVMRRMGLADHMPPVYLAENRAVGSRRWTTQSCGYGKTGPDLAERYGAIYSYSHCHWRMRVVDGWLRTIEIVTTYDPETQVLKVKGKPDRRLVSTYSGGDWEDV